ncbi:hypothetical protein PYW08_014561 [Mythimna loreyi]|uniref:Uncharacterized protein n=1 Tax=Mythimna loreyi TaxID=667449 RepID=A0ACC2R2H7_9NEOP|nr:hypothetical protein PYW08_014561 [Mythimna loreyi]
MSDNFIPLNQSTPVQNRWQQDKGQQQRYNNRQQQGGKWRGGQNHNNWNNSRNSSYGSISSNNSFSHERHNIDSYLHPSMLQDPWASLRQYNANRHNSST